MGGGGATGTRFFVHAGELSGLYGGVLADTTVVLSTCTGRVLQPSGESRVEVLDFNVHALRARPPRRSLQLRVSEKPIEGSRLMCEKSVFPTGGGQRSGVPAPGQGYSILRDRWRLLGLKVRVPPSEEQGPVRHMWENNGKRIW